LSLIKSDWRVNQIVGVSPEAFWPAVRVQCILTLVKGHCKNILSLTKVLC
jgi:hypothetical protein